jgi:diguanylate cyclase (GGDEF)-like protein
MIKRLFFRDSFTSNKEKVLHENMKRIKLFTMIIMILEATFLIASYIVPHIFATDKLAMYRIHYYVLLIGSSFMMYSIFRYSKKHLYKRIYEWVVYIGLSGALLWGASLSILDLDSHATMTVYLTFVFITSFALIVRPDVSLFILTIVQSVFIIRLIPQASFIAYSVNSTVFILFAWFVGRYQYYMICDRFKKDDIITEKNGVLAKQNVELVKLMMKDHLTGVYNRYSLDDILAKKWMEAYVHQTTIAVLMIDIDSFKKFNDTYGHIQGDNCLKSVSKILLSVSDRYDGYTFRYGGDEFCMIFSNQKYIESIIDDINKSISEQEFKINEEVIPIRLSIGMFAEIPEKDNDQWCCIDRADQALYQEKSHRYRRKNDELA